VKIISYFGDDPLRTMLYVITAFALAVTIKQYRRQKDLRIFAFYTFLSLVQDVSAIGPYMLGMDKFVPMLIHVLATYLFMLTEFTVCIYFILRYVPTKWRRRAIKIDALLFALLFVVTLALRLPFFFNTALFSLQSLFLVVPPLLYFYEQFSGAGQSRLKEEPSFWIITGILFLICCRVPLMFAVGYLGKYIDLAVEFNYLLYICFFLLLIKAYRCRPGFHRAVFSSP
jgi:hypothetical protein